MAERTVDVILEVDDETGDSKIEVEGAQGNECLGVTKDFEAALGSVDESERQKKPEFEKKRRARNSNHLKQ